MFVENYVDELEQREKIVDENPIPPKSKHERISSPLKHEIDDECEEEQIKFSDDPNIYKLQIAAKNNNIEEINSCIKSYNFDDEDGSVDSPLLIAVIFENYEVARILWQAHVDVLVEKVHGPDAASKELYHAYKHKMETFHNEFFVPQMMNKKFDSVRMGKVLVELNCDLRQVVKFRNAVMTRTFLENTSHNNTIKFFATMPDDMHGFDLNHIEVLINCEPGTELRKHNFVFTLVHNIENYEKSEEGREFIEKISRWDVLDEEFFTILHDLFLGMSKGKAKLFLKYRFDKVAKEKYGRYITSNLIGNYNPKVILWMQNQNIDVDKRICNRNTFLHIATTKKLNTNIEFLVNKYADPNACNNAGETPFSIAIRFWNNQFWCTEESIKLLLFRGGDLKTISHQFNDTFFGLNLNQRVSESDMNIVKLFIARLAIYEADGQSVAKPLNILKMINNLELQKYLEICRIQLKKLKVHEIVNIRNEKFSLITILNEKPEKLARYVNKKCLKKIKSIIVKYNRKSLDAYYIELLKRQIKAISEIRSCRIKAIETACMLTGIKGPDHLIVQKIVQYLTVADLLMFKSERYCFFKRKKKVVVENIFG